MEQDTLAEFDQVTRIFKEKFQSETVKKNNEAYLKSLDEKLNEWKSNINEQIIKFIEKKRNELRQVYDQYCHEINDKYTDIEERIETNNLSSNIHDQIGNFNNYCQSNTLEKRIRLNIKLLREEQLTELIHMEFISYDDLVPETNMIPSKPATGEIPTTNYIIDVSPGVVVTLSSMQSSSSNYSKDIDNKDKSTSKQIIVSPTKEPSFLSRTSSPIIDDSSPKGLFKKDERLEIIKLVPLLYGNSVFLNH